MNAPFDRAQGAAAYPNLARVFDDLRNLRAKSHQTRYGGKPPPELPSRNTIVEIVDGLVASLFPRHFGPPGLVGEDLDAFVADVMSQLSAR